MSANRNRSFWVAALLSLSALSPVVLPVPVALAKVPLKKKPAAAAHAVDADPAAEAPQPSHGVTPMLPGATSKDPINIDAGKLDYFDKDQKMIYTGDVVAVQGASTLKASKLTILLEKADPATPGAAPAPQSSTPGAPSSGSQVKQMDAEGPVTLISKDQIGTGDTARYVKAENKVYLDGNVTLTQGTNVTQGSHLIYDMTTGLAQVFSGDSNNGRVSSVFTPGSNGPDVGGDGGKKDKAGKEKTASGKRHPAAKSASTAPPVDDEPQ